MKDETSTRDAFQIARDCEARWKTNPQVRAEFASLEAFMAYETARANGLIGTGFQRQIKFEEKRRERVAS